MKNNTLSIENFGPVKKAEISISPLTIFICKNNTGKSYSALLFHSLFDEHNFHRYSQKVLKLFKNNSSSVFNEFRKSLKDHMSLKEDISDKEFKFPSEKFNIILTDTVGKVYCEMVEEKLKSIFSDDLDKLNRCGKYSFKFSFNGNFFENMCGDLKLREFIVNHEIKKDYCFKIDDKYLTVNLNYFSECNIEDLSETVFMMVVSQIIDILNRKSYHIPSRYNYFSNDFKGIINEDVRKKLDKNSYQIPFFDIAESLEEEILGGEVKLKNGEIVFCEAESGMEFELKMMSSSVQKIAPIILYLKYIRNIRMN